MSLFRKKKNMDNRLKTFEKYVAEGMTTENMERALELIGARIYDEETLENMKIYSDYLPMMKAYTKTYSN